MCQYRVYFLYLLQKECRKANVIFIIVNDAIVDVIVITVGVTYNILCYYLIGLDYQG